MADEHPGVPPARRKFAGAWIKRAGAATFQSAHRASLWTTLAAVVIGTAINWWRLRHPAHFPVRQVNLWTAVWPSLVVAGVVLFLFFVFHLFATPFRIAKDAKLENARLLSEEQVLRHETSARLDEERTAYTATKERLTQENSSLQRQLDARPTSDHHRDDLKSVLADLLTSVECGFACGIQDAHDRDAIRAHWPALFSKLTAWNKIVNSNRAQRDHFQERLKFEMEQAGVIPGPFNVPVITSDVTGLVLDLTAQGFEHVPDLRWKDRPWTDANGETHVYCQWLDRGETILDGRHVSDRGLALDTCKEALVSLIQSALAWPETTGLVGDDAVNQDQAFRRESLRTELTRLGRLSVFQVADGCPLCP